MYEWSEEQLMVRDAIRRFIDAEVVPQIDAVEHEGVPPYDIIRKMYATFGMDQMARDRFKKQLERKVAGTTETAEERAERAGDGGAAAMTLIPIIELCRHCPGIVTSMGVSVGLAAGTIMKGGTPAQMERWGLDLLTPEKIGAWAITEPNSGSDALGGMTTTARRDGDEYVINGSKTWITNGPYADTIVLLRQARRRQRHARPRPPGADLRPRQGHARARAVQAAAQDGPPLLPHRRALPDRRAGGPGPPARARPRSRRAERGPRVGQGQLRDRAGGRGRHGARRDRGVPASSRSSTPRTGSCGASPSASSSSSSSSWPGWRSPA